MAKVTEGFAIFTVLFKISQYGPQSRHNFAGGNQVFVDEVQPIAEDAADALAAAICHANERTVRGALQAVGRG